MEESPRPLCLGLFSLDLHSMQRLQDVDLWAQLTSEEYNRYVLGEERWVYFVRKAESQSVVFSRREDNVNVTPSILERCRAMDSLSFFLIENSS